MKTFPDHYEPTADELQANLEALVDAFPSDAEDRFTGIARWRGQGRVYGGQVIAQALSAAMRTVDPDRPVHSLHAYFLRAANEGHEIEFRASREFDGRSFSNRRVIATQKNEPVLNFSASFQKMEDGPGFQTAMPDVPAPEELKNRSALLKDMGDKVPERMKPMLARPDPLDVRMIGESPFSSENHDRDPNHALWFKTHRPVRGGPNTHAAILAFVTDMAPMAVAFNPHRGKRFHRVSVASLDHVIWFHEPVRVDEWLLYSSQTDWSGHARAHAQGRIFTRDGRLVASIAQEGLMRLEPRSD